MVGGDVGGEEGEGGELRWSVVTWVGRKEREESYGGRW